MIGFKWVMGTVDLTYVTPRTSSAQRLQDMTCDHQSCLQKVPHDILPHQCLFVMLFKDALINMMVRRLPTTPQAPALV